MNCPEPHRFTRKELNARLAPCIGKTVREIDSSHVLQSSKGNNKGIVGHVLEQSVLGYPADSAQRPDLVVDGIETEFKSTGIIDDKKNDDYEFQAKEPMSITAVSPDRIVGEQFATSHFWAKLEHLLLVYYFYAGRDVDYADFVIKGFEFHEWSDEDRGILEQDWSLVRDFIATLQRDYEDPKAEYPRISSELNRQLMYLDTSPKWPNPPRFRIKRKVVTSLIREHFSAKGQATVGSYSSYAAIDAACGEFARLHAGKTLARLMDELAIAPSKNGKVSKAAAEQVVVRIFGGPHTRAKKMRDIELFARIGLEAKCIVITASGGRTEDMKLLPVNFDEIEDTSVSFEESTLYDYFSSNQLILAVFEEPRPGAPYGENVFRGFKRLWFDEQFVEREVRRTWDKVRQLVVGKELRIIPKYKKDGSRKVTPKTNMPVESPNFPKSSDGPVFLRGSGADAKDKKLVINGLRMYRQNYWLQGIFIVKLMEELPFL